MHYSQTMDDAERSKLELAYLLLGYTRKSETPGIPCGYCNGSGTLDGKGIINDVPCFCREHGADERRAAQGE